MNRHHPDAVGPVPAGCSAASLLDEALNTVAVSAFAVNDLACRILDESEPKTAAEARLRGQSFAMLLAMAMQNLVHAARAAIGEVSGPHAEHIVTAFARFDAALPGASEMCDILDARAGWSRRAVDVQRDGSGQHHAPARDADRWRQQVFCKMTDGSCLLHVGPCALDVSLAREQAVALLHAIAEDCLDDEPAICM